MLDMHIHSTFSDGSDNVEKLCEYTKDFELFSITDHNNIEAGKIVKSANFVPGVEFSFSGSDFNLSNKYEIHLLGYNYDPHNKRLNELISEFNYYNNLVFYKILCDIAIKHKLKIDFYLLKDLIDKGITLNKAWITKFLIKNGVSTGLLATYNKYVKECLNTQYYYLKFKEIFECIKSNNGYLLLAHPMAYGLDKNGLDELIETSASLGLDGIEIANNHNDQLMRYIKHYNFIYSVGSDYHGSDYDRLNSLGINDNLYKSDEKFIKNVLILR